MTEAEILRRRELRRAAIKKQKRRRTLFLTACGLAAVLLITGIVLLSSSYSGIFDATGLLNGFERAIASLARRIGAFRATALVSVPVSAISCNQTLAAILTCRLCRTGYPDRRALALPLENSVILIAALVPWSIACSVPCATLGVGMECLPYALYLYLVPLLYAFRKGA